MAMGNKFGRMVRSMMDNGHQIKLMAKGRSFRLTVIFMKANGSTIKLMVLERINMSMEQSILVSGYKTVKMEPVLRIGQMDLSMRVSTKKD
jgi:hypothetical protein